MKTTISIVAITLIGIFICQYKFMNQNKVATPLELQYDTNKLEQPINVVYFQDATGSVTSNGVEVITSRIFTPYYNDSHRDIQLSFGIINERTAKKLITLELRVNRLCKPIMPNWKHIPFEVQNDVKKRFIAAQERYTADSIAYCIKRTAAISIFQKQVDAAIAPYLSRLASSTDLIPVSKIADKAFSYCFSPSATNYLILNSDGQDSRRRRPSKLKNKAEVILINSNGNETTSMDEIVTLSLQSTEQAIEYTLNGHNLNHK